jgi:indolepyruvate ferredoxin oxidoreductase alpha subunit
MTGHQPNPTTGFTIRNEPATAVDLEALCRAVGIRRVRVVDPYDLKETERAVREELAAQEPSVIIARRPCALLKSVKPGRPLRVDAGRCTGCGACMRIGCPSISMEGGRAKIDFTTAGCACAGRSADSARSKGGTGACLM